MFNVRKTKRIVKIEDLEPQRCEEMKGIVAPEIGPKSFWTFENQATGPTSSCSVEDTTLTARQITIEQTTPMVLIESHVGFSAVMIASHVRNEYAVFFC